MIRIYIGPSIEGLTQNTIFNGSSLPPNVQSIIASHPNIAGLIVPLKGLQEARENIRKPGHILNTYLKHIFDKEKQHGL